MLKAETNINERKRHFEMELNERLHKSNEEKTSNYELLRPTFGQPARKHDLEQIDTRERRRQDDISKKIQILRTDAIVMITDGLWQKLILYLFQEDLQTNAQSTVNSFATSAELLLILFDEILTADEIKRTSKKTNETPRLLTGRELFRTATGQAISPRIDPTSTSRSTLGGFRSPSADWTKTRSLARSALIEWVCELPTRIDHLQETCIGDQSTAQSICRDCHAEDNVTTTRNHDASRSCLSGSSSLHSRHSPHNSVYCRSTRSCLERY